MLYSTLLALTATIATTVNAIPYTPPSQDLVVAPGTFYVTNFKFDCTILDCTWSFTLAVGPNVNHHPEIKTPLACSGTLKQDTTWSRCGDSKKFKLSDNQILYAYIDIPVDAHVLKLAYWTAERKSFSSYEYYGETQVYAAETGGSIGGSPQGTEPQKAEFNVKEKRGVHLGLRKLGAPE